MASGTEKVDIGRDRMKRVWKPIRSCCKNPLAFFDRQSSRTINADYKDLEVVLSVYSGVPNPQWIVKPDFPTYASIISNLHIAEGRQHIPPILGYRGFLVRMKLNGRSVTREVPCCHGDKHLQILLLDTCPSYIKEDGLSDIIRKCVYDDYSRIPCTCNRGLT